MRNSISLASFVFGLALCFVGALPAGAGTNIQVPYPINTNIGSNQTFSDGFGYWYAGNNDLTQQSASVSAWIEVPDQVSWSYSNLQSAYWSPSAFIWQFDVSGIVGQKVTNVGNYSEQSNIHRGGISSSLSISSDYPPNPVNGNYLELISGWFSVSPAVLDSGNFQYNEWLNYDGFTYYDAEITVIGHLTDPKLQLSSMSMNMPVAVPEPAAMSLMALSAVGLLRRRRK